MCHGICIGSVRPTACSACRVRKLRLPAALQVLLGASLYALCNVGQEALLGELRSPLESELHSVGICAGIGSGGDPLRLPSPFCLNICQPVPLLTWCCG